MSNPRVPAATLAGVLLVFGWIAGAVLLADHVRPLGTVVEFVYFAAAGLGWVLPAAGLMRWAVGRR